MCDVDLCGVEHAVGVVGDVEFADDGVVAFCVLAFGEFGVETILAPPFVVGYRDAGVVLFGVGGWFVCWL